MKYIPDRKSGLDPLFGLPATRESKAMDNARNRNFRSDKRLEDSLKTIDHTMHTKIIRCQTQVTKTRDFLATIKPDPEKKVVCPPGLSSQQKQTIRVLRRGSVPSMSLREFDERLSSARVNRDITTASEHKESSNRTKRELCEYKLKRKLFSGNSKKYALSQSTPNMDLCLMDNVQSTRNPLYRCKTVMGGAYQRLTSADVNKSNLKDQAGKIVTITELDKDLRQSSGTARACRKKAITPPRGHHRLRRRMTVSDLKSLQDSSNASSDSSGLTDEERYERFLTVLKGETTKLPEIFTYH